MVVVCGFTSLGGCAPWLAIEVADPGLVRRGTPRAAPIAIPPPGVEAGVSTVGPVVAPVENDIVSAARRNSARATGEPQQRRPLADQDQREDDDQEREDGDEDGDGCLVGVGGKGSDPAPVARRV